MYKYFVKRLLDFIIAFCTLAFIWPILLIITIWLHFANKKSGAFFFQERPGKDGKIFKVIKFKSMTDECDAEGNLLPDSERITTVGKFVRATSIDELPQLINVLKGDMALIGPRPLLVKYFPYYTQREQLRHTVRPGITGWAQVNGRNNLRWDDRLECDAWYVEHCSFMLDLKIVYKTIMNVVTQKDIALVVTTPDLDDIRRKEVMIYNLKNSNAPIIIQNIIVEDLPIKLVRDDLFPSVGGGNKGRKAVEYEKELKELDYNAIVTTGGIQSNHNRAMALLAAKNGWKCHLVYHGTEERFNAENGNALLVRCTKATKEFVEASCISEAMNNAMAAYKKEGLKPYYVTGGGHDMSGGRAYMKAIQQMYAYGKLYNYKPDYIFHASGTGSTQAGILVGLESVGWGDVKVIGISVARQQERGKQVVTEFANKLAEHQGINADFTDRVHFVTDYLFGGYEQFSPEMKDFLDYAMQETGIIFDTTYSGKAFYGMYDYVKRNGIKDNILFWHTGGLMNIQK